MASKKAAEAKPSRKDSKKLRKPSLRPTKAKKRRLGDGDSKVKKKSKKSDLKTDGEQEPECGIEVQAPVAKQLEFFKKQFESANGVKLSSLELESMKDKCFVELPNDQNQDVDNLGNHVKAIFGESWNETLCERELEDGKIDPGSPAVLLVSSSALRSLELLRGVRSLTKECPAVKLFSKHMKVEEQVALLKKRVNIAGGTPSRIKKLIDIEALGLSRLRVIMLDMHTDVKGYSLITLPQVRDEFWELYRSYLHGKVLEGAVRICLYGPLPTCSKIKGKKKKDSDE